MNQKLTAIGLVIFFGAATVFVFHRLSRQMADLAVYDIANTQNLKIESIGVGLKGGAIQESKVNWATALIGYPKSPEGNTSIALLLNHEAIKGAKIDTIELSVESGKKTFRASWHSNGGNASGILVALLPPIVNPGEASQQSLRAHLLFWCEP